MPRGVKGSGPPKASAKSQARTAVQAAAPAAAPAPAAQPAAANHAVNLDGPLGSVDIDSLSHDDLRTYAGRLGVSKRDIADLTEDRLRQNTKLFLQNHFDLLTE